MRSPPRLNQRTLSVIQRQDSRAAPQRVPHLLYESQSLSDGHPVDFYWRIDHHRNLPLSLILDNS